MKLSSLLAFALCIMIVIIAPVAFYYVWNRFKNEKSIKVEDVQSERTIFLVGFIPSRNQTSAAVTNLSGVNITWKRLNFTEEMVEHRVAKIENFLFLLSGIRRIRRYCLEPSKELYIYDFSKRRWFTGGFQMNVSRVGVAMASVEDTLYLCGGINMVPICSYGDPERIDTCLMYTFASSSWVEFSGNGQEDISHQQMVVQGKNLYIFGGRSRDKVTHDAAFKYEIATQKWSQISSLNHARSKHAAVMHENRVITCCGVNAFEETIDSCESYDFENNRWIIIDGLQIQKDVSPRLYLFTIKDILVAYWSNSVEHGNASMPIQLYKDGNWHQTDKILPFGDTADLYSVLM